MNNIPISKQVGKTTVSLWQCFRLLFVILFLYLLQDVLFRYDGIIYYSTFSDFLPSIALISIFWSIAAVFMAIIVWLLLRVVEWISQRLAWRINADNLLLFTSIFISFAIIIWLSKKAIFGGGSLFLVKLLVLLTAVIFSTFLTWKLRGKLEIVQERLTPLVWLFAIIVIISIPLVSYSVWIKGGSKLISQESTKSSLVHQNKPNIILITFDALTARDMSLYGYHRPTTPFISEWSKNATVFTKAEAQSNYTYPTTLSLMTGQRPWTHMQYNPNGRNTLTPNNLARVLKKNNYYNMIFTQNPLASAKRLGIEEDFDINFATGWNKSGSVLGGIDDLLYIYFNDSILMSDWIIKPDFLFGMLIAKASPDNFVTQYSIRKVFNNILSNLSDNPKKPFFVWTHLNPPHDPYLPPEPYIGLFDSSSRLRTQKSQYEFTRPDENAQIVKADQETITVLRARYNEFIRYCDEEFKYFIAQLEKRDILKDTVIILSSDHGESFEHGMFSHGGGLYEEMTHIPLVIREPNQTKGRIVNNRVEQVDISATILDLANISVPLWMEGRSLKPSLHGKVLSPNPAFSMSLSRNRQFEEISHGLIAVWDGDYKLIYDFNSKKSLFFDLAQDPSELNDLYEKKPEAAEQLMSLIKGNLIKANKRIRTLQ